VARAIERASLLWRSEVVDGFKGKQEFVRLAHFVVMLDPKLD
jgi:hypothetical protein